MLKNEIIERIYGVEHCPACGIMSVEHKDQICSECVKEGWKWEDVETDRGIQKILTN